VTVFIFKNYLHAMKWIAVIAALILIASCFYPWIFIESENLTVTGVSAASLKLGKPAYFHFFLAAVYMAFHFTARVWAKRWNLLVAALNLAWAVRNFLLVSACAAGECPQKKWALYLVLISAILMMVAALFPKISIESKLAGRPGH
jgi:hypothetical protein